MSDANGSDNLLDVRGIGIQFGGLRAVKDFSIRLGRRALCGVIGPNGAGKTTVFNLMTGVYCAQEGSIKLKGEELVGLKPYQIAKAGLSRTFQNIRLFPQLSVLDNVRVGCHLRGKHSLRATLLRTPGYRRQEEEMRGRAMELLKVFGLEDRQCEKASSLPYGDQRRLEIARAVATRPCVLLLDEPAAGMNPQEKIELMQLIRLIRDRFDLGILLIEHDMKLVMSICECITVLDHGEIIAVGSASEIQCHPKVIEAYLGEPVSVDQKSSS